MSLSRGPRARSNRGGKNSSPRRDPLGRGNLRRPLAYILDVQRAERRLRSGRADGTRIRFMLDKIRTYVLLIMAKPSNRDRILEAGLKVMLRKGYVGAGVRDIVAEASAPQGSFTNHFRSKEDFAREVLDVYFAALKRLVAEVLDDANRRPRERLRRYLDLITDRLVAAEFTLGCLIGDFSL